jgi:hypothetical protein
MIDEEKNEITYKCDICDESISKYIYFNSNNSINVSIGTAIDKNTIENHKYLVDIKNEVFDLEKFEKELVSDTYNNNVSGFGISNEHNSLEVRNENKIAYEYVNVDWFKDNYEKYLTDEFISDVEAVENETLSETEFCKKYGNAIVTSTTKYRYCRFYVEILDDLGYDKENNKVDLTIDKLNYEINNYIFNQKEYSIEEEIKINNLITNYDIKFRYTGTEEIKDVKEMFDLFNNLDNYSLTDYTYMNFVNSTSCITDFIPSEYSKAKQLIYDYIWKYSEWLDKYKEESINTIESYFNTIDKKEVEYSYIFIIDEIENAKYAIKNTNSQEEINSIKENAINSIENLRLTNEEYNDIIKCYSSWKYYLENAEIKPKIKYYLGEYDNKQIVVISGCSSLIRVPVYNNYIVMGTNGFYILEYLPEFIGVCYNGNYYDLYDATKSENLGEDVITVNQVDNIYKKYLLIMDQENS